MLAAELFEFIKNTLFFRVPFLTAEILQHP